MRKPVGIDLNDPIIQGALEEGLDSMIQKLQALRASLGPAGKTHGSKRKKRKLTPEARAKMADAQRRRWATYRNNKKNQARH